jgi:Flp pilus assembly pilin Flp
MDDTMSRVYTRIYTVLCGEDGQGLAEYALILTFIAVVSILALTLLGTQISSVLNNVAGDL